MLSEVQLPASAAICCGCFVNHGGSMAKPVDELEVAEHPAVWDVFISASSKDYHYAGQVYDYLTACGIKAFFSHKSLAELGNSDYRKAIDSVLDKAQHMVVVTSLRKNVDSSWVEAEWGFFINEKRSGRKPGNVITITVGPLLPEELPASLRYYEVLPFGKESLEKLLRYVKHPQPDRQREVPVPKESLPSSVFAAWSRLVRTMLLTVVLLIVFAAVYFLVRWRIFDEPMIVALSPTMGTEEQSVYLDESGLEMRCVPGGPFLMGSSEGDSKRLVRSYPDWKAEWFKDERPQRTVVVNAFRMSTYEITNAEYAKFLEANPAHPKPAFWQDERFNGPKQPIVGVAWQDAVNYCAWLSREFKGNYRLPTEAEWEKAACGVERRDFPWGDAPPDFQKANFNKREGKTMVVNSLTEGASPFGFQDMAGNVSEWCSDWYSGDSYDADASSNPSGPSSGREKVVRGGSWEDPVFDVRCSARQKFSIESRREKIGFRVVKIVPQNHGQ
jgi:formylglycine-generating enzyme required for sulfatase activity